MEDKETLGCLENINGDFLLSQAIDQDADDVITYSIPGSQAEARLWHINPTNGEITAIRAMEYSDVPDPLRGT